MNPEVKAWLLNALKTSTDFVLTQAPLTVQEVLKWAVISNAVWCVVFVVLTCVVAYRLHVFSATLTDRDDDPEVVTVIKWAVLIVGMAVSFETGMAALQAYLTPRAYLLQQVIGG